MRSKIAIENYVIVYARAHDGFLRDTRFSSPCPARGPKRRIRFTINLERVRENLFRISRDGDAQNVYQKLPVEDMPPSYRTSLRSRLTIPSDSNGYSSLRKSVSRSQNTFNELQFRTSELVGTDFSSDRFSRGRYYT